MQEGEASLLVKAWRLVLDYGKGALLGLSLYLLLCAFVFFCGFMISMGNETSWSGPILRAVGAFFFVADPLWGIPTSAVLGIIILKDR